MWLVLVCVCGVCWPRIVYCRLARCYKGNTYCIFAFHLLVLLLLLLQKKCDHELICLLLWLLVVVIKSQRKKTQ